MRFSTYSRFVYGITFLVIKLALGEFSAILVEGRQKTQMLDLMESL